MTASILPALLLAAVGLSATEQTALDATVAEIFRPYGEEANDKPPWDYPIYSAETAALIAHWQRVVPQDEPDELNDGDWLCLCQDWDAEEFKAILGSREALSADTAQVEVKLDLGFGEGRDAKLILKKEGTSWRLDDLFAESFPRGLKQALRETIAADEARVAGETK